MRAICSILIFAALLFCNQARAADDNTESIFVRAKLRSGLEFSGKLLSFEKGVFVIKQYNAKEARIKTSELAKISFHLRKAQPAAKPKHTIAKNVINELRTMRKKGTLDSELKRLSAELGNSKNPQQAMKLFVRAIVAKSILSGPRDSRDYKDALIGSVKDDKTRKALEKNAPAIMREIMQLMRGTGRGGRGGKNRPPRNND